MREDLLKKLKKFLKDFLIKSPIIVITGAYLFGLALGLFIGYMLATNLRKCDVITKPTSNIGELLTTAEEPLEINLEDASVCVEVSGAVMTPGVYCLDTDSMVIGAINNAGGINIDSYAERYVSRSINFARPLVDNEKIYIPFQDEQLCVLKEFAYIDDLSESRNGSILGRIEGVLGAIKELVDNKESDISNKVSELEKLINEADPYEGTEIGDVYQSEDCINLNSSTLDQLISLEGVGESTAQKILDSRPYTAIEDLLNVSGIGDSKYNAIKDFVCI